MCCDQVSYSVALGAVFIEGALFILLSVTGVRQSLVGLMPRNLLLAMAAGIGLFLAMVGAWSLPTTPASKVLLLITVVCLL